jgi:hypothetical protein
LGVREDATFTEQDAGNGQGPNLTTMTGQARIGRIGAVDEADGPGQTFTSSSLAALLLENVFLPLHDASGKI